MKTDRKITFVCRMADLETKVESGAVNFADGSQFILEGMHCMTRPPVNPERPGGCMAEEWFEALKVTPRSWLKRFFQKSKAASVSQGDKSFLGIWKPEYDNVV